MTTVRNLLYFRFEKHITGITFSNTDTYGTW